MKAPVTRGPNLGHLPPSDGWQMPITAIASDIMPIVEEAVAEFTQRAQGLSARGQEVIAEYGTPISSQTLKRLQAHFDTDPKQ
jgi:hypothetical protein